MILLAQSHQPDNACLLTYLLCYRIAVPTRKITALNRLQPRQSLFLAQANRQPALPAARHRPPLRCASPLKTTATPVPTVFACNAATSTTSSMACVCPRVLLDTPTAASATSTEIAQKLLPPQLRPPRPASQGQPRACFAQRPALSAWCVKTSATYTLDGVWLPAPRAMWQKARAFTAAPVSYRRLLSARQVSPLCIKVARSTTHTKGQLTFASQQPWIARLRSTPLSFRWSSAPCSATRCPPVWGFSPGSKTTTKSSGAQD